jgi:hypothetical protein
MGRECSTFTKPSRGLPPTRCVGELLELLHQPVEIRIGNLRSIQDVIQMLMPADFIAQAFDFSYGIFAACRHGFKVLFSI